MARGGRARPVAEAPWLAVYGAHDDARQSLAHTGAVRRLECACGARRSLTPQYDPTLRRSRDCSTGSGEDSSTSAEGLVRQDLADAGVQLHPDIGHVARRVAHAIGVFALHAFVGDLLEHGA